MIPIANMIQSSGYQAAFLWFGLGQGIVVMLVGLMLRAPQASEVLTPAAPAVPTVDLAAPAGMSDESLAKKTGLSFHPLDNYF